MVDVKQIIDEIEEKQEKHFTEKERKVLECFGELMNMMWNDQNKNESDRMV